MNLAPETPTLAPDPDVVAPVTGGTDAGAPAGRKSFWRRLVSRRFLFISVMVHVVFGLVATVFIVQTVTAKRKLTFVSAPPSPLRSTRATEHRVQMAQKQKSMSAPASPKRVTTNAANAKVALPAMPAMPALASMSAPAKMSGVGGVGFGPSILGAPGGGGAAGGPVPFFGFAGGGKGLAGTFYDLKQTPDRQPTNMDPKGYAKVITGFVRSGFSAGALSRYYKSDKRLFTTSIWIPHLPAEQGPVAFQLADVVKPSMWCVLYKGRVTPSQSFTFHFVGAGDDLLLVKFDGRLVLARNWDNPRFGIVDTGWKPVANYDYGFTQIPQGFAKGNAISVLAGRAYDIEIMIGEQPGGEVFSTLLQEIEGAAYDKDKKGNPILPVFRMSDAVPAASAPGREFPPHRDDGPVWKAEPGTDAFSMFDR